jgi:hypothetical protein
MTARTSKREGYSDISRLHCCSSATSGGSGNAYEGDRLIKEFDMNSKMSRWTKTLVGLSALWLCVQSSTAWAAPAATEQATANAIEPGQPSATTEMTNFSNTYAQREKVAQAQQNFEGGGAGLYIGGSTAAVVLLLVLLIVVL